MPGFVQLNAARAVRDKYISVFLITVFYRLKFYDGSLISERPFPEFIVFVFGGKSIQLFNNSPAVAEYSSSESFIIGEIDLPRRGMSHKREAGVIHPITIAERHSRTVMADVSVDCSDPVGIVDFFSGFEDLSADPKLFSCKVCTAPRNFQIGGNAVGYISYDSPDGRSCDL